MSEDLTEGGKRPWLRKERREKEFVQRLSIVLVAGAFIGGFIVLLDIRLDLQWWGQSVRLGENGFSPDTKGMVLQSMLISGFAAVVGFWLGTTKQGQEQAQSVSRIAETVPVAAAVAASVLPSSQVPGIVPPLKTDEVNVTTTGDVNVDHASQKLCPNCKAPQEPDALFCNKCGTAQPKET